MARSKQHPDIGKFYAEYTGEFDTDDNAYRILTYDTPEEALAARVDEGVSDGDVIYVYAVVGVKVVRQPTLTENVQA